MTGDVILGVIVAAFLAYEGVAHFLWHNRPGSETLSALIARMERGRWWVRAIVALALAVLFPHLVFQAY